MRPWVSLSAVFMLAMASHATHAGPEVRRDIGVDVNGTTPVFRDVGTVIRENRRVNGNTLRCWQEGRLFYEGGGFRGAPGGHGIVLRREGESEVTLFDFRNGLCILSSN